MKYKNIKSMAHNFSSSFLNYHNFVVVEELKKMTREANGGQITIYWMSEKILSADGFTTNIESSVSCYRAGLPKFAESHGVDITHIKEFRTELFKGLNYQLYARTYVRDDREKEHISDVLL